MTQRRVVDQINKVLAMPDGKRTKLQSGDELVYRWANGGCLDLDNLVVRRPTGKGDTITLRWVYRESEGAKEVSEERLNLKTRWSEPDTVHLLVSIIVSCAGLTIVRARGNQHQVTFRVQ